MSKTFLLVSSDGVKFEVEDAVLMESEVLRLIFGYDEDKNEFDDGFKDPCITFPPLQKVPSNILVKVIEYCKKHSDKTLSDEDLKVFDSQFVKLDNPTLFGLIVAGRYLAIKSLMNLTLQVVVDMIDDMTPEEICKTLDIKDDITPEEVNDIYQTYSSGFESVM